MIVALVIFLVMAGALIVIIFDIPVFGGLSPGARSSMKSMLASQHGASSHDSRNVAGTAKKKLFDSAKESKVEIKIDSRLTLEKKLKYAQWKIPAPMFYLSVVGISLLVFSIILKMGFSVFFALATIGAGPLFMFWLLNLFVERRFKAFDQDYPSFLLSLVGLLKTGMDPMTALEAAAQGLEEGSLVKQEVEVMLERLRFGVSEDKSIGSFGEDIFHPEIELFVQALLLSRRVGGTLSDTLERLAKQVRKRQYFRSSAKAAVGMQRGSILFIVFILIGMMAYIAFTLPDTISAAVNDSMGWMLWQIGITAILLGIFLVRQVTKLKL